MPKEWIKERLRPLFNLVDNDQVRINLLHAIPLWIASLVTGLVAVGYTRLFNLSEDLLHRILKWHSSFLFLLAPLGFLAAWLVVRMFSPEAKGSGIPQVMAAIDLSTEKHAKGISRLLSPRVIFIKIVSSLIMVLSGGAIGREGPTIQIAGSVFRFIHKRIPASWPRLSEKSYILTGAAAGLAAAFNTPLGGIVFAIEELARVHISLFRTALFTAVIIAGLTAQELLGPYLYLGYPDVKNLRSFIYLGVIAAAVLSGLLGSLMCKLILKLMRWRQSFRTNETILFLLITGLIVACIAYFLNDQIIGSGKELMNDTLFIKSKEVSWQTVTLRILGPILSFNTGAAGGIFAPSLAAGAAVGAYLSGLFGFVGAHANILILSGMVGFLTGVTRTPFTSAILVLEMTDRHSVIFHLMLAAMVSNIAAMLIEKHSLYEQLKSGFVEEAKKVSAAAP